jgi:regulator of sigma E protease
MELKDVALSPSQVVILGVDKTVGTVIGDTFKQSASICRMVWLSLFDMVTGKYSIKDVSGPIGVVDFVSDATQESVKTSDYTGLLTMMALITINIGIFNLLPVPALDGGRLLFLLIEAVTGHHLDRRIEGYINAVCVMLLLALIILVGVKDIVNLF